jgi:hypothetical protein
VQRGESDVFELVLDGGHAERARERRDDVEAFPGLALLLAGRHATQGLQVVQPVRQLDRDGHAVDESNAVPESPSLVTSTTRSTTFRPKSSRSRSAGAIGVLEDVVEQGGADGRRVRVERDDRGGDRERMGHARLASLALLAAMPVGRRRSLYGLLPYSAALRTSPVAWWTVPRPAFARARMSDSPMTVAMSSARENQSAACSFPRASPRVERAEFSALLADVPEYREGGPVVADGIVGSAQRLLDHALTHQYVRSARQAHLTRMHADRGSSAQFRPVPEFHPFVDDPIWR